MSTEHALFQTGHIERLPLGTLYVGVAHRVRRLLAGLPQGTEVIADFTGVGIAVDEIFHHAGVYPTRLMITSGMTATTTDQGVLHVPKAELISRLQALLHEGRLKIQKDLPEAEVLVRELMDFRIQYTPSGNLTFNARDGKHDDLVLALAIACYRAAGDGQRYEGLLEWYRRQAPLRVAAPRYFVGVDLGQMRDPSAIAVVRRVDYPTRAEARDPEFLPNAAAAAV
jgi:hypothetical protein